jgi:hypothetical protein
MKFCRYADTIPEGAYNPISLPAGNILPDKVYRQMLSLLVFGPRSPEHKRSISRGSCPGQEVVFGI